MGILLPRSSPPFIKLNYNLILNRKIDLPAENLLSCDTYGIGKPARESYVPVLEKLSKTAKEEHIWFAAAHMWDVSAAKRSGYVFSSPFPIYTLSGIGNVV